MSDCENNEEKSTANVCEVEREPKLDEESSLEKSSLEKSSVENTSIENTSIEKSSVEQFNLEECNIGNNGDAKIENSSENGSLAGEGKVEKRKPCSSAVDASRKLKILAIHGYRQNAEVFRRKTGSFRKMLHKWASFTFVTAPHKVYLVPDLTDTETIDIGQAQDEEQYGWFFNRDDHTFRGIRCGGPAIGFEESVKLIESAWEKFGPFDGIFGFSQGACFAALLCDLQQRGMLKCNFKFAILVSGFKSGSLPHAKYYSQQLTIPSLHVFGRSDNIIPTDMSIALRDCFDNAATLVHSGGHYLPANTDQKNAYQKFVKEHFANKQEDEEEEEGECS